MGNRLDSTLRGLLIPDDRMGVDGLAGNDNSLTGSSYTQQGGRAGSSSTADPNSRIVPVVSGGQSDDLQVEVVQAGDPGIAVDSARAHWKYSTEGAFDWRGLAQPNYAAGWAEVFISSQSQAESSFDVVVDPVSQRVLVAFRYERALLRDVKFRRSVNVTGWEDAGTIADPSGSAHYPIGLVVLPSGRVLCVWLGGVYFSDNAFEASAPTWAFYAANELTDTTAPAGFLADQYRLEADRDGNVALFAVQESAGVGRGFVVQHVSRNLGANFVELGAVDVAGANYPRLRSTVLPTGEIVVAYLFSLSPRVRVLASAFDLLSEAVEVVVDPGLAVAFEVSLWSDSRGVLFLLTGSLVQPVSYRSLDKGQTWERFDWSCFNNPGAFNRVSIRNHQTVGARGGAVLVHGSQTTTALDGNSLGGLWLGGWTSIEPTSGIGVGSTSSPLLQLGWRDDAGLGAVLGRTWIAMDEPDLTTDNWTRTAIGAGTMTRGAISVAATDELYQESTWLGGEALFATVIEQGGSISVPRHAVRVVQGVYEFEIKFREINGNSPSRVTDVHAGVDVFEVPLGTFDDVEPVYMRIGYAGAGALYLHYKSGNSNRWIEALEAYALTAGPAGGNSIAFGAFGVTGGASEQVWPFFFLRDNGAIPLNPTYSDAATATNRQHRGAALSGSALSLDRVGVIDVDEAALALRGGPARFEELHDIAALHDFGLAAALFDSGPSRVERWRSVGEAGDEVIAWRFEQATRIGGSWLLGLVVLDANFETAYLEVDTLGTGASWTRVATLNLAQGFEDLAYERHGDILRPGVLDPGTIEGDRFLNRAEFAGGVARWGLFPSARGFARIENQSAGGWTSIGTNTIQPFVRVDSTKVAGTSAASDGTAAPLPDVLSLQAPSGLIVAQLNEVYVYGVRVVVPAANTPEGYREAGLIMPAAFSAMGQQWSRGYSLEAVPNAIRDETRGGTIRKRQEGAPSLRASLSWPDGVKLDQMRAGTNCDYLGPVGKPPAVADSDVWGQLWGILDETRSGEIPVVYVAELPAAGVTLTDRTLWSFGTLDGSARFEHALGDEGVDEFGRVSGVQITGIR